MKVLPVVHRPSITRLQGGRLILQLPSTVGEDLGIILAAVRDLDLLALEDPRYRNLAGALVSLMTEDN